MPTNKTDSNAYQKFESFRDSINKKYLIDDYYFLIVGQTTQNDIDFGPFDENIKESDQRALLNRVVRSYYNYLYIPAESSISDVTQIGNAYMQKLMDMELKKELRGILKPENNQGIMSDLNKALKNQVDKINSIIKEFDEAYEYQSRNRKQNLTPDDIIESIIESYFSVKSLSKNKKSIDQLSSGEQRIALLSLLVAFSKQNKTKNKQFVLAIDEPEISLNFEKVFEQFERLISVSSVHTQVIATTHWYGVLPLLNDGNICYVSKNQNGIIEHMLFEGNSFQDQDFREFNRSIELKSYHDLTASILSSVRLGMNWIICEGLTDKKYFEYYLFNKSYLRVLSVKGAGNVAKLYQYLATPMLYGEFDKSNFGKVLCVIDTDSNATVSESLKDIISPRHKKIKNLKVKRIAHSSREEQLVGIDYTKMVYSSSIEDVLNPKQLLNSIKKSISEENPELASKMKYNDKRTANFHSVVNSEFESILDKTDLSEEEIKFIYERLKNGEFKDRVASIYVNSEKQEIPIFFENILKKEFDGFESKH